MEIAMEFWELWNGMAFTLPMAHWALVLGALALCMIWGRYKIGLAGAFTIFMYWGFLANRAGIMNFIERDMIGMFAAIFVALTMTVLVMVALLDEIQ